MGLRDTIRTSSFKILAPIYWWGQPDWIAITASLAAFLVYVNTLKAGFVYDDSRAILTNPDIRPETPWSNLLENDFWGTPLQNSGSHKSYRPLATLSFRLNFLLSGLNPWPYHLTNVLLHTITTWLFVCVARLVFCSKSCMYLNTLCNVMNTSSTSGNNGPFSNSHSSKFLSGSCQRKGRFTEVTSSRNLAVLLSSLLFALHPIHTEAVAGLVGRADVGSTAFALLSFISYMKFVKFRDKSRINSALITNTRNYYFNQQQYNSSGSNNSSRSHSPLCPNKNKKAVNNHYHNHHQHHHHDNLDNHSTSSPRPTKGSSGGGFTNLSTRFSHILSCFSSFLLTRMKTFVVNSKGVEGEDVKTGMKLTTTKGPSDVSTPTITLGGNGFQKTKGTVCDSIGDVGSPKSGIYRVEGGCTVIWFFWLRKALWFIATIGFAAAAMLTKEQGITILLVCATYDLVRSLVRTRHLYQERISFLRLECRWSLLLLALSSICLLYLRLSLMGPNFAAPVFSKADNSIAHQSSFWIRLGTFLFLPVFNFGLIIFPHPLSYDWSMDAIPPIQSFWELRNIITLTFYGILIKSIYSLIRKLLQSSQEIRETPSMTLRNNLYSTPKRATTNNVRSRRDFLYVNGHSDNNASSSCCSSSSSSSSNGGVQSGNFSFQWWSWPSSWSSCYFMSSSAPSITSSVNSGSAFPHSSSISASSEDVLRPTTSYPYNNFASGNSPNRKDYCNVCHLWMSSSRKQQHHHQHQHNNNNSIWNDDSAEPIDRPPESSAEYLDFFGGNHHHHHPEGDCDDTSSNGSSCSSRSSTSSNSSTSSKSSAYSSSNNNGLIRNGHQGRSNHYRSSESTPPLASAQSQNFRYRVTGNGRNETNICNGFGNGCAPLPSHSQTYGNGVINNNNPSSSSRFSMLSPLLFSSPTVESFVESSSISRSSEASTAFQCATVLVQLSFLVLPFLPATNLFFYVGFVVAERVLYMPSVGFCLLLGHGFLLAWNRLKCHHHHHNHHHHTQIQKHHYHHIHQKQRHHHSSRGQGHHHHHHHHRYNNNTNKSTYYNTNASFIPGSNHFTLKRQKRLRKLFILSIITSLFALSLRTLRRNGDWEDEGKLYRAGIQVNPPKSWGNLGIVLSNQGKLKEAEQAYRKALHFRSNLADVHYNLGILLENQGRLDEALESYRSAIHFRPKLAPAYVNAGQVLTRLGRISMAREMYTNCLSISDEGIKDLRNHLEAKTSAYLRLGKLLVEDEDDPRAAIGVYRQAVKLMPQDYSQKQAVYNSLGEALYRNGQPEEAEQWFIKALRTKPDHIPAHLTYGKMLARNKTRLLEAESWFRRAKKIAPADSSVYHHYGQFLSFQGRHSEAAESYVTAANLAPNDYDIIVGAANSLRLSGDNAQAELYYKKAAALRPQEARAHMNYGAILHVNGKYTEATKSYLTALRLKPEDDVTLMNLKKVMAISKSSKSLVLISCQRDNKNLL